MSIVAFFLAAIAAIIAWWLAGQRLTSRPWLEVGHFHDRRGATRLPPAKIGLGVFLAVVGALFSLAISAYFMRMASSDWGALPLPGLLWLNTGILAAGSITLHWTKVEAERRNDEAARIGLLAGLALASLSWRVSSSPGVRCRTPDISSPEIRPTASSICLRACTACTSSGGFSLSAG